MTLADDSTRVTGPGLIAMWAAPRSRSTAFFRYVLEHGGLVAIHEPFDNIADHGSTRVNGHPVADPAQLITTLRGLAEGPSQSSSTPANAMLAGFSAHHEPFYRALRDHRMAIS
jgi:hypothetical protein